MYGSLEDRGKIFTNVITKISVDVIIQTISNRIEGVLHVRPDERFLDEINQDKTFLPVTNAVIFNAAGEEISRSDFIVINRAHVIWVIPTNEPGKAAK